MRELGDRETWASISELGADSHETVPNLRIGRRAYGEPSVGQGMGQVKLVRGSRLLRGSRLGHCLR